MPKTRLLFIAALYPVLLLLLGAAVFFCAWVFTERVNRLYQGQIYPNVYALGVDLSGLTREEAVTALNAVSGGLSIGQLVLTDGDRRWTYDWSEIGMRVDEHAIAQAAYAVGRDEGLLARLSLWLRYRDVEPRFAFNAEAARGVLAALAEEVSQPPVEATLRLEHGEVQVVPGEPGRVLDVTNTLARLTAIQGDVFLTELPLEFKIVQPAEPDAEQVKAQAEALLQNTITVSAYDVLTEATLTWTLDRPVIAQWLHLVPGPEGELEVAVNLYAIQETLVRLAEGLGDGRGFRYEEAAQQVLAAFEAGEPTVELYLTHPERTYTVQSGDTLTSLSAKFGMPPGLVAAANTDINIDRLSVGQQITIPSQDVLTPYMPVPNKKIVVSIDEQRTRVYENGTLLYDWIVSTGIESSPTHRGTFQVLAKHEESYASQWDLRMPYFISVYPAGGGIENGFHELPFLSNGQRLWEGNLGRPVSFGCIILGIPDAEILYNWAEVGTVVVIE